MVLGKDVKICLFFGFVFLAVSAVLFAIQRSDANEKTLILIQNDIDELEDDDEFNKKELSKLQIKIKTQNKRLKFFCYLFAGMLVALAFVGLF